MGDGWWGGSRSGCTMRTRPAVRRTGWVTIVRIFVRMPMVTVRFERVCAVCSHRCATWIRQSPHGRQIGVALEPFVYYVCAVGAQKLFGRHSGAVPCLRVGVVVVACEGASTSSHVASIAERNAGSRPLSGCPMNRVHLSPQHLAVVVTVFCRHFVSSFVDFVMRPSPRIRMPRPPACGSGHSVARPVSTG